MEISEELLRKIYTKNYFHGEEYLDYLSDKHAIQKNFTKRVEQLKKQNNIEESNINALEIGCAYGFFGETFRNYFKDAAYLGIDIVAEAITYGKETLGLNLKLENYLDHLSVEKYTHIFMWDVIEHLHRPDLFIEKIAKEAYINSELYITTGDVGSMLSKMQKQKWRLIHPPSHLHYFSKKTIGLLLKKYGFEIESIKYKPVYRSLKQIFYSLFLLNNPDCLICRKIFNIIPEKLFFPLNTFDIMHIKAIKK
ncbi:MAG: methyltransferase domain-containing protein [Bacteroidota bacterium]|nr:methyltransferase domain-containing protein [Bacteroidota bacterium]